MMTRKQYEDRREFFRIKAEYELSKGNEMEAEYAIGVSRGLDLAFEDGSAKRLVM